MELFKKELGKAPRPDVVLITCLMTYWYPGVQLAVECIRKQLGSVPIILGGVYCTLLPEHAGRYSGADIIIQGPGERKILEVLNEVLAEDLDQEKRSQDDDDFPIPAFDLLSGTDVLPLLTSRGCPYSCSFCASHLLYEGFKRRSIPSVIYEIERDVLEFKARNIAFYDDSLLLDKEMHFAPILDKVAAKRLPVSFHTPNGLHVREIDRDMALLMKKANVKSIYLSQESFSDKILDSSCSKVRPGDLNRALSHLEEAGYVRHDINVYLLTGLPDQDKHSVEKDILQVLELGAKPYLAFFSPVPGTEEWRELVHSGELRTTDDPLLHNKNVFPFLWGKIGPEDLNSLKWLSSGDRINRDRSG
jgi:radical SAM superfamily enzyme YgiQ (UPF0313 family)